MMSSDPMYFSRRTIRTAIFAAIAGTMGLGVFLCGGGTALMSISPADLVDANSDVPREQDWTVSHGFSASELSVAFDADDLARCQGPLAEMFAGAEHVTVAGYMLQRIDDAPEASNPQLAAGQSRSFHSRGGLHTIYAVVSITGDGNASLVLRQSVGVQSLLK
jgi:hypothetical protein